jgi:hypothetical protein
MRIYFVVEMKAYLNITFAIVLRHSEMFLRPFVPLPLRQASQEQCADRRHGGTKCSPNGSKILIFCVSN